MFTLKFMQCNKGHEKTRVVSAMRFDKKELADGMVIVTAYGGYTEGSGLIEIFLTDSFEDFHTCYVENLAGKTIDRMNQNCTLRKAEADNRAKS